MKSQLGVMEKLTGLEGRSSGPVCPAQLDHRYDLDWVLHHLASVFTSIKWIHWRQYFPKRLQTTNFFLCIIFSWTLIPLSNIYLKIKPQTPRWFFFLLRVHFLKQSIFFLQMKRVFFLTVKWYMFRKAQRIKSPYNDTMEVTMSVFTISASATGIILAGA